MSTSESTRGWKDSKKLRITATFSTDKSGQVYVSDCMKSTEIVEQIIGLTNTVLARQCKFFFFVIFTLLWNVSFLISCFLLSDQSRFLPADFLRQSLCRRTSTSCFKSHRHRSKCDYPGLAELSAELFSLVIGVQTEVLFILSFPLAPFLRLPFDIFQAKILRESALWPLLSLGARYFGKLYT